MILMNAAERFQQEVDQSVRAGNGVIFCRSDDPNRVMQLLSPLTMQYDNVGKGMALWNITDGLSELNTGNSINAPVEKTDSKFAKKETGTKPAIGAKDTLDSFADIDNPMLKDYNHLIMMWLNMVMDEAKPFMQKLFNLHTELTMVRKEDDNMGRRLYIIVPEHWDAPQELNDIPMINLQLPVSEELAEMAGDFLNADDEVIADPLKPFNFNDDEIISIGDAGVGMRCSTFMDSVLRVSNMRPKYDGNQMSSEEFALEIRDIKIKEVNKHAALHYETNLVNEEDVAGLDRIKLQCAIDRSALTAGAKLRGVRVPKGSFLAGSPGVGKSYVAKMMAYILGIPMIHFNLNAVHGKYVGESGKNLRAALDIIKAQGKVLVLIDEVEKVVSKGQSGDSGASQGVLGELLTFMNDNDSGCYFVLTANNTAGLPPEMLRSGRIDNSWFVDIPNEVEREASFKIHIGKAGIDIPNDLNLAVEASEHYTHADIEEHVVKAVRVRNHFHGDTNITGADILTEMEDFVPQNIKFASDYNRMTEWASLYAKPASSPPQSNNVVSDAVAVEAAPRQRSRVVR